MSRSLFKGPVFSSNLKKKNNKIIIFKSNQTILPSHINFIAKIYNGCKNKNIKIQENMIGFKFGEFLKTRKNFKYKKK